MKLDIDVFSRETRWLSAENTGVLFKLFMAYADGGDPLPDDVFTLQKIAWCGDCTIDPDDEIFINFFDATDEGDEDDFLYPSSRFFTKKSGAN